MKFSNNLSFAILTTGMIVLILLSFIVYIFSYNSIIKSQLTYTKSITNQVSEDIDQLLHEKVKTALTLANTRIINKSLEASNLSYANLSDAKRKESIKLLNGKWKSTKDPTDNFILKFTDNKVSRFLKDQQTILKGEYGEIFLTNKFGALVASTSKLSTFAHGRKYWWLGSYNNGEGTIFFDDRGYDDSVDGYVLGLVVPIRKGTEIIGILKCNLNVLGTVSKLIIGAKDELLGEFKLTRSGGIVVFEEGFEPLSTQIHNSIFKKIESKNTESFVFNDSGEKYLVGFSEIKLTKGEKGYGFGGTFESIDHKKGNTGESWHVICYRQMCVILSPITKAMKSIIIVSIIIILILVIVSQLFGRKIAKPLAILDKATGNIGKGNFEYRIAMERNDEFGNLANSFNSMASRLQQTTTSIELLRESEERLKVSEKRSRTWLEYSPVCTKIVDFDFNLQYMSSAGIKGHKIDDITQHYGKPYPFDFYPESFRSQMTKNLEKVRETGEIITQEASAVDIEGNELWFHSTLVPVNDEKGRIDYIIVVSIDRTERKRAEEEKKELESQLRQAAKIETVGTLAGGIAHDFNNILGIIIGNTELAIYDIPDWNPARINLAEIKTAGMRAKDVVRQLLNFSRKSEQEKRPIKIHTIVKESIQLLRASIPTTIELRSNIPTDLGTIMADPTQIHQILINLCTNAAHAMDENGGILEISLDEVKLDKESSKYLQANIRPYIQLTISDTGCGIAPKIKERIFDPYFTTKEVGKGSGIGLSVVYGIVKNHDGTISVYSEHNKGTTIKVLFPVIDEKPVQEIVTSEELPRGNENILLIDDEEAIIKMEQQILERLGYQVEAKTNPIEALDQFRSNPNQFDLIITDMTMPHMTGGKLAEEILKIRSNMPIILCTGFSQKISKESAGEIGIRKYIEKPLNKHALSIAIREVLDEK